MKIQQQAWNLEAEAGLSKTLGNDRDEIKRQIDESIAELWKLGDDSFLVTRIERGELVIMCYEGTNARAMMNACVAAAKRSGLRSVRFHTERPALTRLLKGYDFKKAEEVYRLEL